MNKLKRSLSILLAILLIASTFAVSSQATGAKELKIISYNVAGLPVSTDVPFNQLELGEQLSKSGYDIIAVQEDFTFHDALVERLSTELYPFRSFHSGGVPGGDGLNIFSKYKLFNEERITWNSLSGVVDGGADELTPKGILYACIELEDGIYLDFYTIHADAYGDKGSVEARSDNFRQLAEIIKKRGTSRPLIITGDFNTAQHFKGESSAEVYRTALVKDCNLKDSWIEIKNGGNYTDFSSWSGDYWGNWDSVDKVLYRDGDGVKLTPTAFDYKYYKNIKNESISDHSAALATFTYEKTDIFTENEDDMEVSKPEKNRNIFAFIKYVIMDLFKLLTDFDRLLEVLGINK